MGITQPITSSLWKVKNLKESRVSENNDSNSKLLMPTCCQLCRYANGHLARLKISLHTKASAISPRLRILFFTRAVGKITLLNSMPSMASKTKQKIDNVLEIERIISLWRNRTLLFAVPGCNGTQIKLRRYTSYKNVKKTFQQLTAQYKPNFQIRNNSTWFKTISAIIFLAGLIKCRQIVPTNNKIKKKFCFANQEQDFSTRPRK